MVRTQIQLTPDQAVTLKRLAAQRGVSMAEVVRQSIDAFIRGQHEPGEEEVRRRALGIAGMVKCGPADISIRHDDYLEEAYDR